MWTFSHHFQSFWHMGISFFNFHFHPFYFMSNPTTFSLSHSHSPLSISSEMNFFCVFLSPVTFPIVLFCDLFVSSSSSFCIFPFFTLMFNYDGISSKLIVCRTNLFFLLLLKWWWLCITLESERVFFSFPKRVRNTWTWTNSKSQGLLKQWCQSKGK